MTRISCTPTRTNSIRRVLSSTRFSSPDWSPDLLRTVNYICHLVSVRRSLYDAVGGFDPVSMAPKTMTSYFGRQRRHVMSAMWQMSSITGVSIPARRHPTSRAKPEAHAAGRRALENFVGDTSLVRGWNPGPRSRRIGSDTRCATRRCPSSSLSETSPS